MSDNLNKFWLFIIAFLLVSLVCGGIILVIKQNSHQPAEIILSPGTPPQYQGEIYIGGAVVNPGIYSLNKDSTIETILQTAGLMPDANPDYVKIHVPSINESNLPQRISLNHAGTWLLVALPGIGESKAQAIVDYRNQHGRFHRIEDLLMVEGIGNSTLDMIREMITIED